MENIITLNRDWFVDRQAFEIVCTELGIPLNTGQYKVQVVEFNVELDSVSVNEIKRTEEQVDVPSVFETKSKIPLANDGTDIEIVWWWSNGAEEIRKELAEHGFSSTYKYSERLSDDYLDSDEIGRAWNSGTLTYPNHKKADQICAGECGVEIMEDYNPKHKYSTLKKGG